MTAFMIISLMLGAGVHDTTAELAEAIDTVCGSDHDCTLDAIATCYRESRCRMGLCDTNGCGPFQQLARYAHETSGDHDARRKVLASDALAATRQWYATRARYKSRHGSQWVYRYCGRRPTCRGYVERWDKTRRWAQSVSRSLSSKGVQ